MPNYLYDLSASRTRDSKRRQGRGGARRCRRKRSANGRVGRKMECEKLHDRGLGRRPALALQECPYHDPTDQTRRLSVCREIRASAALRYLPSRVTLSSRSISAQVSWWTGFVERFAHALYWLRTPSGAAATTSAPWPYETTWDLSTRIRGRHTSGTPVLQTAGRR